VVQMIMVMIGWDARHGMAWQLDAMYEGWMDGWLVEELCSDDGVMSFMIVRSG